MADAFEILLTPEGIARDLAALGVVRGDALLVHSALSRLGFVPGGPQGVIEGLVAAVGPQGLVAMPTFTEGLSDPALWKRPPVPQAWHEEIRRTMPAYDPKASPVPSVGKINDCFRSWPDVARGPHPLSSFAALGPGADDIVAPQPLEAAFGESSPLARLEARGAKILFLGAGFRNCTAFHLAEHRAGCLPAAVASGARMRVDGESIWVAFEKPDYQGEDFGALGADLEKETDLVSVGPVGAAECRLVAMCDALHFATGWLKRHRPTGASAAGTQGPHTSLS
ncbi:MAG: AAC(3) family N-acetyltransferase [Alphaproteobacteria bacterium]|nr:AAC(3) family N-acetyltransferase [Alphaproteobacteria bacterium]